MSDLQIDEPYNLTQSNYMLAKYSIKVSDTPPQIILTPHEEYQDRLIGPKALIRRDPNEENVHKHSLIQCAGCMCIPCRYCLTKVKRLYYAIMDCLLVCMKKNEDRPRWYCCESTCCRINLKTEF